MEQILCRVVESSCLPTHNIVPHIYWHDLPYRRTKKKYEGFPSMVIFQFSLRKFVIPTWFCNCQQYPCLFHIIFEYIPGIHDQRKMLFFQISFFIEYFPHRTNVLFLSIQFLCLPHTQIRIIFFHGVRISTPNWKPSPNRTSIGFCQIVVPITVLPKDDRTDFAQEERLGLPLLEHDFGHLCRGRRIPNVWTFRFSNFQ